MTGCIRPSLIDRLNQLDEGGQYDSSGGREGRGNPRDSVCVGCVTFNTLDLRLIVKSLN